MAMRDSERSCLVLLGAMVAGCGGRVELSAIDGTGMPADGAGASEIVAIAQSTQSWADEITQSDIDAMVADVVSEAGGLDFIHEGHTVVLKPNLVTSTVSGHLLPPTVNGVTTDWRVTRAVARLVRDRVGTSGQILIMEGSAESTRQAFLRLGYTPDNFGTLVDEFIALEGSSCGDRSATGLLREPAINGRLYWVNQRYFEANWLITIPALKTHAQAGITGGVKNIGIGATPASQYSASGCSRTQSALYIDHSHGWLDQFISDYFSIRPADFVVMDGLQGLQHGPDPGYVEGGNYTTDRMNMRLILAAKNAVALDTIEALVMGCNPKRIEYLTRLEEDGFGTTDTAAIRVVGKQVSEVQKQFAGPDWACSTL
jgi:uncharacterized protein (DUF362 family)